ncbi:MAG: hypothetical protein K2X99_00765 [Gemmatimonadaceae bacterium]|nr:hypothetical protein [Gemmatimonadaceae bacterium]
MNDTHPEASAVLAQLYRAASPEARLRMATSMFGVAKELMLAGIRAEWPTLSPRDERVKLLERLYGDELTARARAEVADGVAPEPSRSTPRT